jgi:hypothetical protein
MESKITRIAYSELRNLGDYENCRVEAEAVVAPGENPSKVMKHLRGWVRTQADDAAETYDED